LNKISSWLGQRVASNTSIGVEIAEACAPTQGRNATELLASAKLRPANEYEPLFESRKAS
jgi:hypothetical protein